MYRLKVKAGDQSISEHTCSILDAIRFILKYYTKEFLRADITIIEDDVETSFMNLLSQVCNVSQPLNVEFQFGSRTISFMYSDPIDKWFMFEGDEENSVQVLRKDQEYLNINFDPTIVKKEMNDGREN